MDQHAFELRTRSQEFGILFLCAKSHDMLDASSVVPTAVKQHDLAGAGQVGNIALEVPLGPLRLRGLGQRDVPAASWIERLGDALDRSPFASCVSAFKDNNKLHAGCLDPI